MKKLLLLFVIMLIPVILLAGCTGLLPSEGEGEGESEGETIITLCPSVSIIGEQSINGKTYIQGDVSKTVTITFTEPTEPVSAFIADSINKNPESVPNDAIELILYTEDKMTYTGTATFSGNCEEDYIYVTTCTSCMPCKFPYIVDNVPPYAKIEICTADCTCEGCTLSFNSTSTDGGCSEDIVNCGDSCSGLSSWSIDLYDEYPFDDCCLASCTEPVSSCSGDSCPIECVTGCLTNKSSYFVVVTLSDKVGNSSKWGAEITYDNTLCEAISLSYLDANDCLNTPCSVQSELIICEELAARLLTFNLNPSAGGIATDQTGTSPYIKDEEVEILATPATGYTFVNWTTSGGTYDTNFDDVNDPSTTFTMPAANVTVSANFEKIPYNLTMAKDPSAGGTATDETGTNPYVMDDSINILATPATGYEFVNWTATAGSFDNANSASTTFTMPASDTSVTAHFEVSEYTLSMSVDPIGGGAATDQTGSGPYAESASVSILATPASGYAFLYWTTPSGTYDANFADANDPSTTFTMPAANTTAIARFLQFTQSKKVFSETCNQWTADQSAGGLGITIDIWDITSVSDGHPIDLYFNAYSVPDRWFIYYNGALAYETGWRGSATYNGNPLYPGGIAGIGEGTVLGVITKINGVNTLEIRTEGAESGTASYYRLREDCT